MLAIILLVASGSEVCDSAVGNTVLILVLTGVLFKTGIDVPSTRPSVRRVDGDIDDN